LPAEDHLQGLALPLDGSFVDENYPGALCPGPDDALEAAHLDKAQAVQPNVDVVPLTDVPSEYAFTVIVGRGLREFTRAGNVAPADVEAVRTTCPSGT
jgi:hypothetical protein